MKKILMSALGLMLMFAIASKLTAGDDQKPPRAKLEEITKNMTADQKKQFDQLQKAEKDALAAYKESKTDANEKKAKEAIKARIEFVAQVTGRDTTNIDEMVNKQFKRLTEGSAKKADKKQ